MWTSHPAWTSNLATYHLCASALVIVVLVLVCRRKNLIDVDGHEVPPICSKRLWSAIARSRSHDSSKSQCHQESMDTRKVSVDNPRPFHQGFGFCSTWSATVAKCQWGGSNDRTTVQQLKVWNPRSPKGLESLQENAVQIHLVHLGNVWNFQFCTPTGADRGVETLPRWYNGETLSDTYWGLRTQKRAWVPVATCKTFVLIFVK